MNSNEIISKFNRAKYELSLSYDVRKFWFEIELCENYGTYSSHNYYKFSKIYEENGAIVLTNRKGKIVKVLTKDNVAWISYIVLRGKNFYIQLVNYHFTNLEVLKDEI